MPEVIKAGGSSLLSLTLPPNWGSVIPPAGPSCEVWVLGNSDAKSFDVALFSNKWQDRKHKPLGRTVLTSWSLRISCTDRVCLHQRPACSLQALAFSSLYGAGCFQSSSSSPAGGSQSSVKQVFVLVGTLASLPANTGSPAYYLVSFSRVLHGKQLAHKGADEETLGREPLTEEWKEKEGGHGKGPWATTARCCS